jgi:hypothetical protein
LKANFWLIAMACGFFQTLQAMSNRSAVRSGVGALWVGAMSATISALSLVLVAVVIYRLPLPDTSLITAQGLKVVFGGMMGRLSSRASPSSPLGWDRPRRSFSISRSSRLRRRSSTISAFWGRKQGRSKRDSWSACCSPVSGWCSPAPEASHRVRVPALRKRPPTDLAASRPLLDHAVRFTLRYLCP